MAIKTLTKQDVEEFLARFPQHETPDCLIYDEYTYWYGVNGEYINRGGGAMKHIEYQEWKQWPSHWFDGPRYSLGTYVDRNGEAHRQ